jgi:hypothetical protein
MAAGIVTTLLKNIKANLNDSTNYATVAANLKNVFISDDLLILPKQTPYADIVPGTPDEDENQPVTCTLFWQPVFVYVVIRRDKTMTGEAQIVGVGSRDGLDTVAKDVRQALNRPSPYNDAQPSGASYTTQTGVFNVRYEGTEYLGEEEDADLTGVRVAKVNLSYRCADTRKV